MKVSAGHSVLIMCSWCNFCCWISHISFSKSLCPSAVLGFFSHSSWLASPQRTKRGWRWWNPQTVRRPHERGPWELSVASNLLHEVTNATRLPWFLQAWNSGPLKFLSRGSFIRGSFFFPGLQKKYDFFPGSWNSMKFITVYQSRFRLISHTRPFMRGCEVPSFIILASSLPHDTTEIPKLAQCLCASIGYDIDSPAEDQLNLDGTVRQVNFNSVGEVLQAQ